MILLYLLNSSSQLAWASFVLKIQAVVFFWEWHLVSTSKLWLYTSIRHLLRSEAMALLSSTTLQECDFVDPVKTSSDLEICASHTSPMNDDDLPGSPGYIAKRPRRVWLGGFGGKDVVLVHGRGPKV